MGEFEVIFNILKLLVASNVQHRKRSRKKRESADRKARVNLGGMPEHKGMSRGACSEENAEQPECVF